jgi:protein phosphatase
MGTACSALLLTETEGSFCHIGNTRIYRVRGEKVTCLTTDQPAYLGMKGLPELQTQTFQVQEGDLYVLTSDGVHQAVTGMASRLLQLATDPASATELAQSLCELALAEGSRGNVACLIARVR